MPLYSMIGSRGLIGFPSGHPTTVGESFYIVREWNPKLRAFGNPKRRSSTICRNALNERVVYRFVSYV